MTMAQFTKYTYKLVYYCVRVYYWCQIDLVIWGEMNVLNRLKAGTIMCQV